VALGAFDSPRVAPNTFDAHIGHPSVCRILSQLIAGPRSNTRTTQCGTMWHYFRLARDLLLLGAADSFEDARCATTWLGSAKDS